MLENESGKKEELEELNTSPKTISEDQITATQQEDEATAKALESIEEKVAASAEVESEAATSIPTLDVKGLTMEELVDSLNSILKNEKIQTIKSNVETIKSEFEKKFGVLLAEKKATFIKEGGEAIDFHFSSPIKVKFNELISDYKSKKASYYSEIEKQLKQNLNKRLEVIESLKELIEKADSSSMYKEFKELQEQWKNIGAVPRTKYNNTWRNYHHHVERFYDLLHINNDLRELDFKHNLEEKLKLIEKAESLANLEDSGKAFKELQDLHKVWKENIGPVSREHREDVWQRFSAATKKIHDKRDAFYEAQRAAQEKNVSLKLAVVASLEEFDVTKNKTHSDWQKSIKAFEAKREEFFQIGKIPKNKSQEVWEKLKAVTKQFNYEKNKFYKDLNVIQHQNLDKKMELLELAKSLKDSDDFASTTGVMKRIQADWKKIGHVPRKVSDKIWKEFKDACNYYFDRVHKIQDQGTEEEQNALSHKKQYLEELKKLVDSKSVTPLEDVKQHMLVWKNFGHVPRKEKQIEVAYNKLIEKLFGKLNLEGKELALLKFRTIVDGYLATNNSKKLDSEVQFIRKKLDELTKEIQQLETNISFIANAGEENPLVKNVRDSIKKEQEELSLWKEKLAYMRTLSY